MVQLTPFLILWLVHAHAHYKEYDDHDNSKVDSEDDNEDKSTDNNDEDNSEDNNADNFEDDNDEDNREDDNEEKVRIIMTRIIVRTIMRTIMRTMIILQASAVSDLTTAKACLSDPSVSLIHISLILIQPPGPNKTQLIIIIII